LAKGELIMPIAGTQLTAQQAEELAATNVLWNVGSYTQPTGFTTSAVYGIPHYGTKPPEGLVTSIAGVISVIEALKDNLAPNPNPQLVASATGATNYLSYLNTLLSGQLTELFQNLITNLSQIDLPG
jgi:hypothetical protein